MAAWSTVATSNVGRALQDIGATVLHWLKLLQGVVTVSIGAVIAFFDGWALLESDKVRPGLVRQFCLGYVQGYGAPVACPLLPSDVTTIRIIALALLLAGLVLAGRGALVLCNWFLDRKE